MKSPRKLLLTLCTILAAAIAGASSGAGQDTAPPPPQETRQTPGIRVQVNTVLVPVTVKDSGGHPVPGLHREDFRIFEDDVEQKIDRFSDEPFPLSLVVLIDNDLPSGTAKEIESSLPTIVNGISARDEVSVCRFDLNFHPGKSFTADSGALLTELKRTTLASEPDIAAPGGAFGGPTIGGLPVPGSPQANDPAKIKKERRIKALDDAMYEAAGLLHDRGRRGDRRKMVLLISDGEGTKRYKYSFDEAVRALMQGDIAVYSVGVGNAFYNRLRNPLARYAHATGGDIYYAAKREAVEELYARVTEQARTQYTLWYNPHGTDPALDYHSIEVRVKRPGLTVVSRDGYYAPGAVPR
jgi:VWFA-related protein